MFFTVKAFALLKFFRFSGLIFLLRCVVSDLQDYMCYRKTYLQPYAQINCTQARRHLITCTLEFLNRFQAIIYLFKVNNRNTRKKSKICLS